MKIELSRFVVSDLDEILTLFYETVHSVNVKDYTLQQVEVWADSYLNRERWCEVLSKHDTIVAKSDGKIVGFGDMDEDGYLDHLYVHKDAQGCHIASAICDFLEKSHSGCSFVTHASITAKGFFEKRGYVVICEQQVERKGVMLKNYVMKKGQDVS